MVIALFGNTGPIDDQHAVAFGQRCFARMTRYPRQRQRFSVRNVPSQDRWRANGQFSAGRTRGGRCGVASSPRSAAWPRRWRRITQPGATPHPTRAAASRRSVDDRSYPEGARDRTADLNSDRLSVGTLRHRRGACSSFAVRLRRCALRRARAERCPSASD